MRGLLAFSSLLVLGSGFQFERRAPTCNILDAFPYFKTGEVDIRVIDEKPQAQIKNHLKYMIEFSRFMNGKSPYLLQEFAQTKRIFEIKKKLAFIESDILIKQRLMDHAKRPRRSTEEDEKTIEEKEIEKKELTREQRNLTRILAKRSMEDLDKQEFIRLSTGCSMILAGMAEGAKGKGEAEVVLVIKSLGICANFMNTVALKLTEKLKEEMGGRLIVTHLPEEDDLEVLNAAIAKFEEKSFVQTLQEEDKMAPKQFQNEPFDYAAEYRDSKPALAKFEEGSFVQTLQEEDKMAPAQFQNEPFDYAAESRNSKPTLARFEEAFVQTLQEEDKMAPAQFQDESFDYDAESRDSEPMTTIKPDEIGEAIGGEIGEAIGGAIEIVVDNTQNTIEVLQGLLASIGDLVPQIPGIPAQALDMLCVAVWWPLQETHCKETRCAVCSPGVLSAISVCKAAFKTVDHKCVQEVMGEGFCNYCIADFLA